MWHNGQFLFIRFIRTRFNELIMCSQTLYETQKNSHRSHLFAENLTALSKEFEITRIINLIVSKHVIKGIIKLIRTTLNLQLLPVDLILNVVNSLVQLGDVHLSVFKLSLGHLIFTLQVINLFHQLLFSFQSLLCRLLQLLHILSNSLQFFLNSLELILSQLSSLHSSLKLSFLNSKLSAQFIQLLLIIRSHFDGCSQIFVQLLNGHLVVETGVFYNLDGLHDIISSL